MKTKCLFLPLLILLWACESPEAPLAPDYSSRGTIETVVNFTSAVSSNDTAYGLVLAEDGSAYVAGYAREIYIRDSGATYSKFDIVVLKYTPEGELDKTFGDADPSLRDNDAPYNKLGYVRIKHTADPYVDEFAYDLALDSDGNILVTGKAGSHMVAARVTPDGILDAGFGEPQLTQRKGFIVFKDAVGIGWEIEIIGDKVYVAGTRDSQMALWRLTFEGELDTTFGDDDGSGNRTGYAIYIKDANNPVSGCLYGIDTDSQGNILLTGNSGSSLALIKVDPEGSLVSSFGDNGMVFDSASAGRDVMVLNNSYFVSGQKDTKAVLWKFSSTGTLMNDFGDDNDGSGTSDGYIFLSGISASHAWGNRLASDSYGNILTAGSFQFTPPNGVASSAAIVWRITPAGELDKTFGTADEMGIAPGYVFRDFANLDRFLDITLTPEGKIMACGDDFSNGLNTDMALVYIN